MRFDSNAKLTRPPGNITGFATNEATLAGKWLELLSEIAPGLNRAAILFNPDTAPVSAYIRRKFIVLGGSLMDPTLSVFISYSSKDVTHAEALEALLENEGLRVWRDKKRLAATDNYVFSIHDGIKQATRVVVLWSRNSIASEYVAAEAEYARNHKKLVPVDIEPCEPRVPFNIHHRLPFRIVTTEPEILLRALGGQKQRDSINLIFRIAPEDIDTSRLPQTFSPELFGRSSEMAQLYNAWDGGRTHIVVLDAIGGAGKTALVRHFIQMLEEGGWRGAQRLFVWSFFSQGTDENRQGDADPFYVAALTFSGYERVAAEVQARKAVGREPTRREIESAQLALIRAELPTPAKKGRALSRLVCQSRTLLILDGMEPLQYPAGRTGGGKNDNIGVSGALKDKGMAVLLRELAAKNPGLVIVTTRIKIRDLRTQIPKVPIPGSDPVYGKQGPLLRLWRRAPRRRLRRAP
jgi:hypothetical protein